MADSKTSDQSAEAKKPYQAPRLAEFGSVQRLTDAKGSNKSDGTGKPATRNTGANA
jgi:hypothetical protein